jgi:hypothetical protein
LASQEELGSMELAGYIKIIRSDCVRTQQLFQCKLTGCTGHGDTGRRVHCAGRCSALAHPRGIASLVAPSVYEMPEKYALWGLMFTCCIYKITKRISLKFGNMAYTKISWKILIVHNSFLRKVTFCLSAT